MSKNYRDNELNRVTAGWSFTAGPNPWGKPPKFSKVQDAVDFMVDRFSSEKAQETLAAYVVSGIPVSTMGKVIARTGFMENMYNPDVAELMQPAINTYIASVTLDKVGNAPFRLTPDDPLADEMREREEEKRLMLLMEEQQPALARVMYDMEDEDERSRAEEVEEPQSQGFAAPRKETV